ncbi:site-specific integrase [Mycobacterium sp. E787]|uniref:tyrosine-type recombinase/integrase n=1 Tax=Mycobacterium sp. E787 TaxID=1834150 RepID=UPI0007FD2B4F|nr:site-specific integrase [Mycobacterium sp. E787]OBI53599.1 integrase [Mycobacterium sp. E787]
MAREKRPFGNIRRLKSGRYQVRFTDPDGRYITAPKTFGQEIDAQAWLADRRRDIDNGLYNPAAVVKRPRVTFGEYAATWLAGRHVAGRPIKARTRDHYAAILEHHLLPTFGAKPLAAITPGDVRDWHAATLTDRPTMRSHAYSLLRTIFASAVNDELIDANPARIVGAGRSKRAITIRPASVAELGELTAAMPEKLALMVTLASWTAMRFGEIVELRRGDIDLSGEVIRIRRAAVRTKKDGYVTTTPKTDAGMRDVAIPPHIIPAIEAHLAKYVAADRDALVFAAENGGHLQPSTLYRHWYQAREKAGRPDLRFHDLRHSGAVLAAATGATLAELMARLGHSTPTAAMRYQHAAAGRDREIATLLSKLADTP